MTMATRSLPGGASAPPTDTFPIHRILAATDGTPASEHVAAWARDLAPLGGARVWLLHVAPPGEDGRRVLEEERAGLGGVDADAILGFGSPAHEIVGLAESVKADLVIVGSHGHGRIERALLGSVSSAVKDRVGGRVLVARLPPRPARVLAADDGSPEGGAAVRLAEALAARWGARMNLLLVAGAAHAGPRVVARAEELGAGLVVVGSRGRGRLRRLAPGALGDHVLRHSRASVLLVKEAR